jgi:hypothetical protein
VHPADAVVDHAGGQRHVPSDEPLHHLRAERVVPQEQVADTSDENARPHSGSSRLTARHAGDVRRADAFVLGRRVTRRLRGGLLVGRSGRPRRAASRPGRVP